MTDEKMKIAAMQMVSTPVVEENFATARRLITQAAQQGAQLVLLPEYWSIMGMSEADKLGHAEQFGTGPVQDFMAKIAREQRIWLIGGTVPMIAPEPDKVLNTTMVYDPDWRIRDSLRQDPPVQLTKGEETYDEARTIMRGAET